MKYKVFFTATAKSDLRNIALYVAEQSENKEIAIDFVNGLIGRCKRLQEFPLSGAFPKDRVLISAGYRYLVHKDYLIFYTVNEANQAVYISAVFNAKKDYQRVLNSLL